MSVSFVNGLGACSRREFSLLLRPMPDISPGHDRHHRAADDRFGPAPPDLLLPPSNPLTRSQRQRARLSLAPRSSIRAECCRCSPQSLCAPRLGGASVAEDFIQHVGRSEPPCRSPAPESAGGRGRAARRRAITGAISMAGRGGFVDLDPCGSLSTSIPNGTWPASRVATIV